MIVLQQSGGEAVGALVLLMLGLVALFIYLLPAVIAFHKEHANRWVILLLNIFFGYTIIVWLGCLVWSLKLIHDSGDNRGGASGLNIEYGDNLNIVRKIGPVSELVALKQLFDDGVVTQEEFDTQKRKLLS